MDSCFGCRRSASLRSFFEARSKDAVASIKKYRRAVDAFDSTSAALGLICVGTGSVGAGLLASEIGFVPGLVLEVVTGFAGLLHVVGVAASMRCSTKAAKHESVRVLAVSKLNTVHSHISKAAEDCSITDNEYKLILEECEKYCSMKEKLRHKHGPATSSIIDEETKNELMNRGREQASATFIKNSPWNLHLLELCMLPHIVLHTTTTPEHAMRPTAPPPYWV